MAVEAHMETEFKWHCGMRPEKRPRWRMFLTVESLFP